MDKSNRPSQGTFSGGNDDSPFSGGNDDSPFSGGNDDSPFSGGNDDSPFSDQLQRWVNVVQHPEAPSSSRRTTNECASCSLYI
jgi:hypothetical protein